MNTTLFTIVSVFALFAGLNCQQTTIISNNPLMPVASLDLPSFLGRWYVTHASQIPLDTFLKDAYCVLQDYSLMNGASLTSWKPTNLIVIKDVLSFNQNSPGGALVQSVSTLTNNDFLSTPGKFMMKLENGEESLIYIVATGTDYQSPPIIGNRVDPPTDPKQIDPVPPKTHPKIQPKTQPKTHPKLQPKTHPLDTPISGADPATTMLNKYPWVLASDASGTMVMVMARDPVIFRQLYQTEALQKAADLGFSADTTKPIAIQQGAQCVYPPMPALM